MGDRSYRIEPVVCRGVVVKGCESSILFFDDTHTALYYIPFSRILSWRFLGDQVSSELYLHDLQEDDPIEVSVPRWLLIKEGIS